MGAMGRPKRTPAELEASYIAAWELRRDGLKLREIAAELAGEPHYCGSHTTLIGPTGWIARGGAILADEDSARGREARRQMADAAIDEVRVKVRGHVEAGRILDRLGAARLELQAIMAQIQLHGLRAAPEPASINLQNNSTYQPSPALLELLENMARADGQLPPREEES